MSECFWCKKDLLDHTETGLIKCAKMMSAQLKSLKTHTQTLGENT